MLRRMSVRALGVAVAIGWALGAAGSPHPRPGAREDARERPFTLRGADVRLGDALKSWSSMTGLAIEPLWIGDRHAEGLDPERRVSLDAEGGAIEVLEAILLAADEGEGGGATWQTTARGAVQVGPRSRLNAYRRVAVYDVADLLRETPDFADAPAIDLESALSGPQGGSVIRGGSEEGWVRQSTDADRARDLIELIVETVEPDQWTDNGGTAASIWQYGSALVVNAPGYVHRGIAGARGAPAR